MADIGRGYSNPGRGWGDDNGYGGRPNMPGPHPPYGGYPAPPNGPPQSVGGQPGQPGGPSMPYQPPSEIGPPLTGPDPGTQRGLPTPPPAGRYQTMGGVSGGNPAPLMGGAPVNNRSRGIPPGAGQPPNMGGGAPPPMGGNARMPVAPTIGGTNYQSAFAPRVVRGRGM